MFRVRYSPNTILLVAVFALLCLQNSCQGFSILSRTKNDLSLWRKQFATKRNSPPSLPESPSSTDALNIRGGSATLEVPEQQKTTTGLENTHGFQPAKNAGFWSKELLREMLAEAIGTYIVVQLGLGSVVAAIYEGAHVGLFQVAAVWAIVVTIAIAVTGPISGAHLNPAMSLAFALLRPSKAFSFHKFLPYTFAQLIGAITGSWVNLIMFKESILKFEETNHIARGTVESIASAKAFGEYYL